jgi:hypothetical protein
LPIVCLAGRSHPTEKGTARRAKKKKKSAANPLHSKDNASPESLRYKGKVEAETPSWRNNLDATKDYGYPARETGRYGSHPSHDGFDDESKP